MSILETRPSRLVQTIVLGRRGTAAAPIGRSPHHAQANALSGFRARIVPRYADGTMSAATQSRPRPAAQPRHARRWLARLAWACVLALALVLLLPYLLAPLYRFVNPVSTLMLWRWATGARVERTFVPIERMAPALPATVIASEDGRFCSHRGVDWREIRERLDDVDESGAARAGASINQPTAQNLFRV